MDYRHLVPIACEKSDSATISTNHVTAIQSGHQFISSELTVLGRSIQPGFRHRHEVWGPERLKQSDQQTLVPT